VEENALDSPDIREVDGNEDTRDSPLELDAVLGAEDVLEPSEDEIADNGE